jgi:hypothetical protein
MGYGRPEHSVTKRIKSHSKNGYFLVTVLQLDNKGIGSDSLLRLYVMH